MITLTYASVLGLIFVYLSVNVSRGRKRTQTGLGSGSDEALECDIRIHGNFAEYVPLTLLLIGLLEATDAPGILVRWLGGLLVVARLLHIWGLRQSTGESLGRFVGTTITWIIIVVASGMGLYLAFT